jgi:hypothetical protein
MGQYNPHRPSILGQEWAPIRETPFQLDTETERGVTFILDHAAVVVSGAVYIDEVPASAGSSKGVMLAVYEAGTEHLTGPIQRVVIPPASGFWRSHDSSNPLDVDIDPSNITFAQALEKTNDYGKVNVEEDGALYILFDTSSVSAQLAGKRILELNLLYAMSGTQTGVPGALPDLAVTHDLYVQQGNPDSGAQYFIHQGSPEISLLSSTIPKVSKARLGNSMIFDMEQFCGTVPFWKGSAFFPLRNDDLARFDTGNPVSTRMAIEFVQSDGCSGCTSVSLPDNRYTYVALEVIYCEERRLLYGGRGVWPCANWLLDYGQNRIMLKPPDTFGLTGRTLTPGEYTVTVTMADMGDSVNNIGGNYSATGLTQKYPLATHTGVVIDTRPVVGQTFSRATSDLLPRVTLHTASGVVTGVHSYDTLATAPVYDSVDVAPDVVELSGGGAVQYPQVRFYARRFGDTNVALVLRRQSAPTTQVSITVEDFDALPEIVDGWREVTLRFTGTIPTMSDSGATQTWEWVADGLDANNQWEILVPYGASASSGVFDTSRATYGGSLAFTQVGSSSLNNDADATLIFSQDPPPVTGFAVAVAEQALEAVSDECALEPACIPTALFYHHLTWNARDISDPFEDRTTPDGWGDTPDDQPWSHSGGTLDDYFVVSGAGHMEIDAVNTLYTSVIEAQAYNVEVHGVVRVPVVPTGANLTPRVVARQEDASNNYEAQMAISTTGVVQIYLVKRVAGVGSIISTAVTLDGVHAAGDAWHIVLRAQGDTLLAQAWKDSYPRPLNWQSVVNTLPGDSITGTQAGASFRAETGFSGGTIDVEWLEFSATNLDVTAFEVQRRDEVNDEWQTIMLSTGTAVSEFNDYEARVGIESEYRIRTVNALDFYGDWSTAESTLPAPGVVGNGPDGNSVLIFTTNEVQDGSSNLAYVMVWTGDVTEEFGFPEAGTVQLRDLYRRDFPLAFRPLERGGERFSRDIIVQNAAVPTGFVQSGFRSLRDMAWEDVPYVCVRNELGDRWLSTVLVPSGKVQRNRRLYIARIEIIQTTEVPSPVDPTEA